MIKEIGLVVAILFATCTGFAFAQGATPVAQATPRISNKQMGRERIVTLKDRIKSQRQRIGQALMNNTLTSDQAHACGALLDSMEKKMKDERQANGPKKIMTRDAYDAYNASLDQNSSFIGEQRQYFYYYGPYADSGPNYDYYYSEYPVVGSPTPSVSAAQKNNPRLFELRERIQGQRARIKQALDENAITSDQAKSCGVILKGVEQQIKADYKVNGKNKLTLAQYTSMNDSLDENSAFIQESKQYYYYYDDPNYVQWF
jgi:hypothetical protein